MIAAQRKILCLYYKSLSFHYWTILSILYYKLLSFSAAGTKGAYPGGLNISNGTTKSSGYGVSLTNSLTFCSIPSVAIWDVCSSSQLVRNNECWVSSWEFPGLSHFNYSSLFHREKLVFRIQINSAVISITHLVNHLKADLVDSFKCAKMHHRGWSVKWQNASCWSKGLTRCHRIKLCFSVIGCC